MPSSAEQGGQGGCQRCTRSISLLPPIRSRIPHLTGRLHPPTHPRPPACPPTQVRHHHIWVQRVLMAPGGARPAPAGGAFDDLQGQGREGAGSKAAGSLGRLVQDVGGRRQQEQQKRAARS